MAYAASLVQRLFTVALGRPALPHTCQQLVQRWSSTQSAPRQLASDAHALQRVDLSAIAEWLALRNPGLLRPSEYSKSVGATQAAYFQRTDGILSLVEGLHKQGFPQPNPDVKVGTSGPQGSVVPFTIIDDPADWKASSWAGREAEYTYYLTDADVEEIDAAVQALHRRGLSTEADIRALKKEDFPLPSLGPKLVELALNATHGRGFQFIKCFPVDKYAEDRFGLIAAYWGFGLHLGRQLVTQHDYNQETGEIEGSKLNHIVNMGYKDVKGVRQHHAGTRLPFHHDTGAPDIVTLLCLRPAKEGGASRWVSAIAIHNELLRRGRTDLVEVLYKPFKLPKRATQALEFRNERGEIEYEEIIPFEIHDGYLSVFFQSVLYYDLERHGGRLTDLQKEAINAVLSIAWLPEFHFEHTLQKGDIEIIHNPSLMHSRDNFVDGEGEHERRHLLRQWIHTFANRRPIAPTFAPRSNIQPGGGFKVPPGSTMRVPLYPMGLKRS